MYMYVRQSLVTCHSILFLFFRSTTTNFPPATRHAPTTRAQLRGPSTNCRSTPNGGNGWRSPTTNFNDAPIWTRGPATIIIPPSWW